MGDWRSLFVVGEVLCQTLGIKFYLTRWCRQRMFLGILIEVYHASPIFLPIRISRDHIIIFFTEVLPGCQTCRWYAGLVKAIFYPFRDGFAPGVFFQQPELLGHGANCLIVAPGLTDRLYTFSFTINSSKMSAFTIGSDVILFELGVDRQDNIGEETIVLHPGVLGNHALNRRVTVAIHVPIAVVPAGQQTGCIRPYHVYWRTARGGID